MTMSAIVKVSVALPTETKCGTYRDSPRLFTMPSYPDWRRNS